MDEYNALLEQKKRLEEFQEKLKREQILKEQKRKRREKLL